MRHTEKHGPMTIIVVAAFGIVSIGIWASTNLGGSDDAKVIEAAEKHGLANVRITGWNPLECSDGDSIARGFRATNANGRDVTGTICCGYMLKGCTVRW